MNLLFDFITARVKTGAGEYLRRILFEVFKKTGQETHLFALYDSTWGIAYEDLREEELCKSYNVTYIDCRDKNIACLINEYEIDRFFIACGHYYREHPEIVNIKCEVIVVIHDFYGEDNFRDKIYLYNDLITPSATEKPQLKRLGVLRNVPVLRKFINKFDRFSYNYIKRGGNAQYEPMLEHLTPVIDLLCQNKNSKLITVSENSKYSFMYNYCDTHMTPIVLYSPERLNVETSYIENAELANLVNDKAKYILMVSANRGMKNPNKLIAAFREYAKNQKEMYLVTLGYEQKEFENHIPLGFLSDGDLNQVYQHCYALVFPSFYEGFGYPPLEAMRYSKPILCSNTTSMPEIFDDAPIYFSPFYESAIFAALCKLTDDNYDEYAERSRKQYAKIRNRQEQDLQTLINLILAPLK